MNRFVLLATLTIGAAAGAREPAGLDELLKRLEREGRFSGAVVVRDATGVLFSRGYGPADPFAKRAFTPDTPVDSASLAKPVTAAAVLMLARDGKIDLDASVQHYVLEFPYQSITVRHLLAHSAGLPTEEALEPITGKTNRDFLIEMKAKNLDPMFPPGSGFTYCNLCYSTLALLIERVSGQSYLQFVRDRVALPAGVTIRPAKLADWTGRAIGYRQGAGKVHRADSYENELFYGTANFSVSAAQLARWGSEWWGVRIGLIRSQATTTAMIAGRPSGLTWGNWYCAPSGLQCHYLGHHEGFHHMLYWNGARKISVAMVSNNSMAPSMHQALQRALVAYAEGHNPDGLEPELRAAEAEIGTFRLANGELLELVANGRTRIIVRRRLKYPAYLVGGGVRYVPGLDLYFSGDADGCTRFVTLSEDWRGCRNRR